MTSGTANFGSTTTTTTSQPWIDSERTNIKTNSPPPAYAVLPPDREPPAASSQRQTPPASPSSPSPHQHPLTPNAQLSPNLQHQPLPYHPPPAALPLPYPHAETRHPYFGPTPISNQYPLLPYAYYDSPVVADGRARWRFVGALMFGVGVWVIAGVIVGGEIGWGRLFD